VEVVGVVEDGKYTSLTEQPRRVVFRPALQSYSPDTVLVVRSSLPEDDMAAQMRRAVAALDPGLPLHGVGSIAQMLGFAFFPTRAASVALSAFGVLAVMLAATGIYGVAAYAVSRRVREIGIRVAMGARPWQILRFVLGRTIFLLAAGSGLGLAVGVASGRVLSSVVYEASARDPLVIAAALVAMMLIGVAASLAPTRRALSIDPLRALRHE
jgi:predicted lysophospholipase L1 biosynthesis ABC-type transport system permease subunit